jgi:glycosyltransferase involved in cell wall biosynthesis
MNAYKSEDMRLKSLQLAYDADVVIIGSAPEEYVTERIKAGKLTFRYNERWFKSKPWYLSGPTAWINFYNNHIKFRNKPLYMLAASAYTANDVYAIGAYKNKVYKWGYFTAVPEDFKVEASEQDVSTLGITPRIMWCSRFLKLKHPELPVMLAAKLKKNGYRFALNMYGSGEELESTKTLARDWDVEDVVSFCGNFPNQEIQSAMRRHQIFLFTSDKNEGWGAVLNESMSNGCAVVASNRIGAAPFLIKDDENGLIFESESLDSLYSKVKLLLDDEELRKNISRNAYKTMSEMWSPKYAAQRFLQLVKALQGGGDTPFVDGPCSKAYPCKY